MKSDANNYMKNRSEFFELGIVNNVRRVAEFINSEGNGISETGGGCWPWSPVFSARVAAAFLRFYISSMRQASFSIKLPR